MIFANWNQPCAKNFFSYSKTGSAPVLLDSENYSRTFYLVTFSEEVDLGRKYGGTKECILIPKKFIICGIEECEYAVHFSNCQMK